MSLRKKFRGNITHFAYICMVEVYGMLDYFNGFQDDLKCQCLPGLLLCVVECNSIFGPQGLLTAPLYVLVSFFSHMVYSSTLKMKAASTSLTNSTKSQKLMIFIFTTI
jgi:hypothetical protein